MNTADALHKLVNVSPIIENQINDSMANSIQTDFSLRDSIRVLYNEALQILIDLLKDNGISFYSDTEELFSNTYNVDFFITLYQYFIPSQFEKYLKFNSSKLFENILAYTNDASDNEYLVKILEANRDTTRSQFDNELFIFFHDKVTNDSDYTRAIVEKLNDISQTGEINLPNEITEAEIVFLNSIVSEKRWTNKIIANLIHKGGLPMDYQLVNNCCDQFGKEYSMGSNLFLFSKYDEYIESNRSIIEKVIDDIHKKSIFYVDCYTNDELSKLSLDTVVCIILHQFAENHLFNIPVNFTRIIKYAHRDIQVSRIIDMIPRRSLDN